MSRGRETATGSGSGARPPKVLWTLALGLLALTPVAHGTLLPITFTAPSLNADSTPCTDLAWARIYVVLCRSLTDTTMSREIFLSGKEGQTIDDAVPIPSGTVGWMWATAGDGSGNESAPGNQFTFAIPLVESLPPVPPPPPPDPWAGLVGTYYRDTSLGVAATQIDSTVNFYWFQGPIWEGGPSDNASVRWSGILTVPTSGDWTLYVASDDGVRLYVDGALVMDKWGPRWDETAWTGTLTSGPHALTLEYLELGGGAMCRLLWSGPGTEKEIVPATALSH